MSRQGAAAECWGDSRVEFKGGMIAEDGNVLGVSAGSKAVQSHALTVGASARYAGKINRGDYAPAQVWAAGHALDSARFPWARLAPGRRWLWQKSRRDCSGELRDATMCTSGRIRFFGV